MFYRAVSFQAEQGHVTLHCRLRLHEPSDKYVSMESLQEKTSAVGVTSSGAMKSALATRYTDKDAFFAVRLIVSEFFTSQPAQSAFTENVVLVLVFASRCSTHNQLKRQIYKIELASHLCSFSLSYMFLEYAKLGSYTFCICVDFMAAFIVLIFRPVIFMFHFLRRTSFVPAKLAR